MKRAPKSPALAAAVVDEVDLAAAGDGAAGAESAIAGNPNDTR